MSKLKMMPDGYKHDWSAARILFIEGEVDPDDEDKVTYLNLRQIADKTGIPYQQVRAKAGKERWSEERATMQLQLAQRRRKKRANRLASESDNFDDQSLAIAKIGQGLIAARFGEIAQELKIRQKQRELAMSRLEAGEFVDPIELRSAVWFKEISELGNAATRMQELGRRAMGTDVQQVDINVDASLEVGGEVSVRQEMERNDPERLAQMLQIAQRSQIPFFDQITQPELEGGEEIEDAEIVEGENTSYVEFEDEDGEDGDWSVEELQV